MYEQTSYSVHRQNTASNRGGRRKHRVDKSRNEVRFNQLVVCLALFLAVFIGRGGFPEKIQQVSGQLVGMISGDTDFRGAFIELGQSMAEEDSIVGELGAFCVEVFGGDVEIPAVAVFGETEGQQFLSGTPNGAELAAYYLPAGELLIADGGEDVDVQTQPLVVETQADEEIEIAAVGVVMLSVDYTGAELPENYTMDVLSLGGMERTTPVFGTLNSGFGYRVHPVSGGEKFHNGVDISGDVGDPIAAFGSGVVEYTGESDTYGLYFRIDHGNGVKSFYAHCSSILVSASTEVSTGDVVALVGATGEVTGPHLHLEITCNGIHVDPSHYIEFAE